LKKKIRTRKQLLGTIYDNAKARVEGRGSRERSRHIYEGLEIMEKEDFIAYGLENPIFNRLYDNWIATDCNIRFIPSPDRLDPKEGYVPWNIEWVVFSENCRRGWKTGHAKGMKLDQALEKFRYETSRFLNRISEIKIEY